MKSNFATLPVHPTNGADWTRLQTVTSTEYTRTLPTHVGMTSGDKDSHCNPTAQNTRQHKHTFINGRTPLPPSSSSEKSC